MKKAVTAMVFLLSVTSCGIIVKPSNKVLPDPIIKVEGSSNGLFQLGASTFSDGNGCILRVWDSVGNILEKDPLPAQSSYSVSVAFQKTYEVSGVIGYLDAEGIPLLKEREMTSRWTHFKNYDLFDYYGVNLPMELPKNAFDVSGIEAPSEAEFILLGVRFYSRFYGEGKALFYAHLN